LQVKQLIPVRPPIMAITTVAAGVVPLGTPPATSHNNNTRVIQPMIGSLAVLKLLDYRVSMANNIR